MLECPFLKVSRVNVCLRRIGSAPRADLPRTAPRGGRMLATCNDSGEKDPVLVSKESGIFRGYRGDRIAAWLSCVTPQKEG